MPTDLRNAAHTLYVHMNGAEYGPIAVGERDLSQWNETSSLIVMTEKKKARVPVPTEWEGFPVEHAVIGKLRPLSG